MGWDDMGWDGVGWYTFAVENTGNGPPIIIEGKCWCTIAQLAVCDEAIIVILRLTPPVE